MHLMFVDESGDLAPLPIAEPNVQPLVCIVGLVVPQNHLTTLTREWVSLKRRFFPGLCPKHAKPFDWHRAEVKGSDLRKLFRVRSTRRERRHALGFLDKALGLIENHRCCYSARVWIKNPGHAFNGAATYGFSVQDLCTDFQQQLEIQNSTGLVVADSRNPGTNSLLSHSVFTQKYRAAGDPYPRILEAPLFGHSDNHAGLQIADLLASAFLFPICADFFLDGKLTSIHLSQDYRILGERYMRQLKRPQFRYGVASGMAGGLTVADPVGCKGAAHLFRRYCPTMLPLVTVPAPSACVTPETHTAGPPAAITAVALPPMDVKPSSIFTGPS